jgi:hypothetical protein
MGLAVSFPLVSLSLTSTFLVGQFDPSSGKAELFVPVREVRLIDASKAFVICVEKSPAFGIL